MDHTLAVKQYSRSSADQEEPLPHDLRPPHVLRMTMDYLLAKVMDRCDSKDENLGDWYHFLWDRTRGIRKVHIYIKASTYVPIESCNFS
jgi:deoxyribodipyrimidine photolyase-like uncharacterized protein